MARLAILIPDMHGGGAERVALTLIQGFIERGHEVDLILFRSSGELLELIPAVARIIDLNVKRMRHAVRPLACYLRERRPDALQASMWPVTLIAILARHLAGINCRLLVSDHSNVSAQFPDQPWRIKMIGWSMRLLYPLADIRLCVSRDVAADLAAISGLKPDLFEAVYNPVPVRTGKPTAEVEAQWKGRGRRILSVGALKAQKNHALLLRAFAILYKRKPANLIILGKGECRPSLEQMIVELGIGDAVSMPGFALDSTPYYASADAFALSSDFEGFANVLVEAMAAGLPIVSTDCRSGPREVLDEGKYGWLVPVGDAEALAVAMEQALADPPDRELLMIRAQEFRPEIAVERYLELMLPAIV